MGNFEKTSPLDTSMTTSRDMSRDSLRYGLREPSTKNKPPQSPTKAAPENPRKTPFFVGNYELNNWLTPSVTNALPSSLAKSLPHHMKNKTPRNPPRKRRPSTPLKASFSWGKPFLRQTQPPETPAKKRKENKKIRAWEPRPQSFSTLLDLLLRLEPP